jgi:hypothetical protein
MESPVILTKGRFAMPAKDPETQKMIETLGSMRIGDALRVGPDGIPRCFPEQKTQPYKVKRVRAGRTPKAKLMGSAPYTAAQLEQLYFSDTRVISLCSQCDHCETVNVEQLNELASNHKGKKVVIAMGCNNCGSMENALMLTTAIKSLQMLNEHFAPLYDQRNKEGC